MALSWPGGLNSRPFPSLVSPSPITKGKLHGSIDVRLSVMSINKKAQRIDLDTEDNIYHLKVTSVGGRGWLAPWQRHWVTQEIGAGAEGPSEFDQRGVPTMYKSQRQTGPVGSYVIRHREGPLHHLCAVGRDPACLGTRTPTSCP